MGKSDEDYSTDSSEKVSLLPKNEEARTRTLPYPKAVFFILVTEFSERFSYSGIRAILILYLRNVLKFTGDSATLIYHSFVTLCYITPLFGGIIADSLLGKYRTIMYISLIYVFGTVVLSLSAIPVLHLPSIAVTIIGLIFIGIGTGGIKPCVNTFGGDQFVLPEQEKQLVQFFAIFYFAINSGSFFSVYISPILRKDVHCFGEDTCYALAFGAPTVIWIVTICIFFIGKKFYRIKKPEGNVIVNLMGCIWHALFHSNKEKGESLKDSHWLDSAVDKYDKSFIEDVKIFLRILVLYIPLTMFWALYEQQGSTWTLQATRMKGYISESWTLKPDQMQGINSFLVLFLIPVFDRFIYPIMNKLKILTTSLKRMSFGCILIALSFVSAGVVELYVEPTYAVSLNNGETSLDFINGLNCTFNISLTGEHSSYIPIQPFQRSNFEKIPSSVYNIHVLSQDSNQHCNYENINSSQPLVYKFKTLSTLAYTVLIDKKVNASSGFSDVDLRISFEDLKKSKEGNAKIKVVYGIDVINTALKFHSIDGSSYYDTYLNSSTDITFEIEPNRYKISHIVNETVSSHDVLFEEGGNYIIGIFKDLSSQKYILRDYVITKPNSVHMLFLLPQYIILTIAEIFFNITGYAFSYTEAPSSLKSVIQAIWLISIGFGNVLVIIITSLTSKSRPAIQFFMYSFFMLIATFIFIILAFRYVSSKKKVTHNHNSHNSQKRKLSQEFSLDPNEIPGISTELIK